MVVYPDFYVDGGWQAATGTSSLTITNPYTEEVIAEVVECSPADVDAAVASATRAFARWSAAPLADRRAALERLQAALAARTEQFVDVLAREVGVPVAIGRAMQVPMPLRNIAVATESLDSIAWTETVGNSHIHKVPVGVVAAITPWNFPLHQIVAKIVGTIGAGCTAVLKPSEFAPGVARLFMEAVHEADIPAGVVNMVWGGGQVGEHISAHPGIDMISFTGSENVARHIMRAAAPTLKQLALELGGKSAAVLLPDADLNVALPAVFRSCMINSGQTCVAQSRLIVPASLLPQVEEQLIGLAQKPEWRCGDPLAETTHFGPLANQTQFDRVNRAIAAAQAEGARLLCGGQGRPCGIEKGWFVPPTVLTQVRASMAIAQREVFGPVLSVLTYGTEQEAVALANATPYGLSGAVWSADADAAARVARQMRTGQVSINGGPQNFAAPFGGFGLSGYGRENGRFSIEGLLTYQSLQV